MNDIEIHTWWPMLTAASKDLLDGIGNEPLPGTVVEEIRLITGERMPEGQGLTSRDRDFIRTQREAVD